MLLDVVLAGWLHPWVLRNGKVLSRDIILLFINTCGDLLAPSSSSELQGYHDLQWNTAPLRHHYGYWVSLPDITAHQIMCAED